MNDKVLLNDGTSRVLLNDGTSLVLLNTTTATTSIVPILMHQYRARKQ